MAHKHQNSPIAYFKCIFELCLTDHGIYSNNHFSCLTDRVCPIAMGKCAVCPVCQTGQVDEIFDRKQTQKLSDF